MKAFHPFALRMVKTPWSFGCSECNRVNDWLGNMRPCVSVEEEYFEG